MEALLKKLSHFLEKYRSDLTCIEVNSSDVGRCLDFRKSYYEKKKTLTQQEAVAIGFSDGFDEKGVHFYCENQKQNKVVGTVRLLPAFVKNDSELHEMFGLGSFEDPIVKRIMLMGQMDFLPSYQEGLAPLFLILKAYEYALQNSVLFLLTSCEPTRLRFYQRLGFKSFSQIQSMATGGYRIPLYLTVHDFNAFQMNQSPFYQVAKDLKFPTMQAGIDYEAKHLGGSPLVDFGYSNVDLHSFELGYLPLFDDLSQEGRECLLSSAVCIHCQEGDPVLKEGQDGRYFGMVLSGALKVDLGAGRIALLSQGDLFGEIAFLLNVPRTADVSVLCDDTTILYFNQDIIEKLGKASDRECLWANIAREMAAKLAKTPAI